MRSLTLGWVFTIGVGVFAAGCLDFDQYGEGTGGTGGTPAGGAPQGAGGSSPACPSDDFLPAEVCITGGVYDFEGTLFDDWKGFGAGTVGNCSGTCASITLGGDRIDVRTLADPVVVDQCFASINVVDSNATRTFLELVPDDDTKEPVAFPPPDRANNIEVAVVGDSVRFEVGDQSLPALTLDAGITVDQLRIQVRADTIVLEAFAAGEQVACSEQPRPELLNGAMRAGFGIQGSAGQEATFDDYGALSN